MSSSQFDLRYDLSASRVYLTGTQALVRLCLMQQALDQLAGVNTGGYVTGYRGSPLGALDQQFPLAQEYLGQANITFEPALNEDLAATALWGTQQAELRGDGLYDGVFGMWYGKGPGVDRSGDALRHANLAGSSRYGGVLVLTGDDHTCESSTTAHQSEFALMDAMIPVMNPSSVKEIMQYGLHGWALSRYAGVWVGLKAVKDNIESTASVAFTLDDAQRLFDSAAQLPATDLNIRKLDDRHEQERRLHRYKLDAVRDYVRAHDLDRQLPASSASARIGIVSTGKSWLDTCQALEELGFDPQAGLLPQVCLYKVAVPWPLEPEGIKRFADGLDLIIVVEEKRGLIESQIKSILYGLPRAPEVIGKQDEAGAPLFLSDGALEPVSIAVAVGQRMQAMQLDDLPLEALTNRLAALQHQHLDVQSLSVQRTPYFCAGCPHNRSTVVPEGSRAYAGIGCHWLVQLMGRHTEGYTQMGGEGANWIGESHFSRRQHVFQNIGDGTFTHSGVMAIRAAVAANTNITFKVLYNDAVAMTGGQPLEGGLNPYRIVREVLAAGVNKAVYVSDEPGNVNTSQLPAGVDVYHRDAMQSVQRELADRKGVTVLLYEQTCATEKRRRRKRGKLVDPPVRAFINTAVCEGCGDCGVQSNCVALVPVEAAFGRKRAIDQSACNKDFSCVNGFCPAFVTLQGAELRPPEIANAVLPDLPQPDWQRPLDKPWSILLTGVGGTGVVTVSAILGMAAHLEGKGCGIIDMAGLAQKGGAVVSHIKLAATPDAINTIRISQHSADLLLGCDLLVSAGADITEKLNNETSHGVVNIRETMPANFVSQPDMNYPSDIMQQRLKRALAHDRQHFIDASGLAERLFGNTIAGNLFLVGVAWQHGWIPLSHASLTEAIRLNGVQTDMNLRAFEWGRAAVASPESLAEREEQPNESGVLSLDALIEQHTQALSDYQSSGWAQRYRRLVEQIRNNDPTEQKPLTRQVAQSMRHLMMYKDEYEVARLFTQNDFQEQLQSTFTGDYRLEFHLAAPILPKTNQWTGMPAKRTYGPWMLTLFGWLARLRGLRGTPFDLFGYTAERRTERELIADYESLVQTIMSELDQADYGQLVEIAALPLKIRGFGHVKEKSVETYYQQKQRLLSELTRQGSLKEAS